MPSEHQVSLASEEIFYDDDESNNICNTNDSNIKKQKDKYFTAIKKQD